MSDPEMVVQTATSDCSTIINETVCVQADITITPSVVVGTIEYFCVGGPKIGSCTGTPVEKCNFSVSQNICVQVPLTFSVDVDARPAGAACGTPSVGRCKAY